MASRRPVVMHVVHSLEGGGTERMLIALLRSFDHRIVQHVVVTLRDAGSLAAQLSDEVACIPLKITGRSRAGGLRLARICSRLRPSIIHARNVSTWFDAAIATMLFPYPRLVLGFHGLESGGVFSLRDRCVVRLARLLGASFSSVSEQGKRQMVRQLRLTPQLIRHLPNGIDLDRFDALPVGTRSSLRGSLDIQSNDWVVGIVGSLIPVKGHDVLLAAIAKAARIIPNLRLLIVGNGPLRGSLEAASRSLAIRNRVRFTGRRDDVPALLCAMDAYVCASHSEGMSNALLEAMASGLPIISSSVGDHPTFLRHDVDGLLVPPGDASALSQAIQTLFESPGRAVEMGRSARAQVEQHSQAGMADAYQCLYREMLTQQADHTAQSHAFVGECQKVSPVLPCLA